MLKRFLLITLALLMILGCCSCQNNSQKEPDGESESVTDGTPADKVVLSGDTRYRIVYPKDADPASAKRVYNRLKALDKNAIKDDYYTLTTDEAPDDGAPEILVGLTNRTASADAQKALKSYLDFSITVSEKKIVIFANTVERLDDAIKYFVGELVKTDDGMIYYPTSELYSESYTKYPFPSLKIGGADISKFSIILPASATETQKAIAEELRIWLAEQTGSLLPIKPDTEAASSTEIIIGKANRDECSIFDESYASDVFFSTSVSGSKLLLYTGNSGSYHAALSAFKEKVTELNGDVASMETYKAKTFMTDKKAIFIGNSFIYWGGCVTFIENHGIYEEVRAQGGDKGYFNEICKANGINMDVYNYTYGGKDLAWIYENKLTSLDKTFLESIDYVFISEAGGGTKDFLKTIESITALFPNAEETVYLGHEHAFRTNDTNTLDAYPTLSKSGIKVVAWGELVCDIYNGRVEIPGSTLEYNKDSFVKHSTGDMPPHAAVTSLQNTGDSHHQNPLSGYITAQMAFAAISGSSCEGQKYSFCWDKTIAPQYDLENFLECQYNNGHTSNFIQIFNSSTDMLEIQKLMDLYINEYNY